MGNRRINSEDVYRFIYDNIDSVPHLEALLQLWNDRRVWRAEEIAHRLFISEEALAGIMPDLARLRMVEIHAGPPGSYSYRADAATDEMVQAVAETYRRELLKVTHAIHAKASSGAREFGRAFKFKKGSD